MRKIQISDWISWLIILILVGFSLYAYPLLPEQVATHWNFAGEVDDYGSRWTALLLAPILAIVFYLMLKYLPKVDPKKENYEKFSKVYEIIKLSLMVFLAVMHFVVILFNLGYDISVGKIISGMVGLLFVVLGFYMKDLKRNWFVGIKTPWTLSSDRVWEKTHRFGGKIFVLAGILLALAPYLNPNWGLSIMIAIIALVIIIFVYSYLEYKKEKGQTKQ